MHKPYERKVPGGKTALLCLHGILGSPEHFRAFLPYVPESVSVFALLLDGHGGRTQDFSKSSMEKWKAQVHEKLASLSGEYSRIYILGHSMGTLLALDACMSYPKVSGLFLLAVPLRIAVRPAAVFYSLKAYLGLSKDGDPLSSAYEAAHSVTLSKNPFLYIGWLPRYLELFQISRKVRSQMSSVSVPCVIFQSEKDELVSARSARHIPAQENFSSSVLPSARHFVYTPENMDTLGAALHSFLEEAPSL